MKIISDTLKRDVKKILCIKPRGIGDIVLSTIIIDNLIAFFPDVQIDYLVEEFAEPSLINNPFVTKILIMKRREFPLRAALKIRKENYDLVFDLWSNPRTAQITFFSGIKYRVGYAYRGRKYAYNIPATSARGPHHTAEHNLELLKPLNIPVVSKKLQYYISDSEDKSAKEFIKQNFKSNKTLIGILPSGGWESKRCESSKWVEICESLQKKYDCSILIIAGLGDEKDADSIMNNIKGNAVKGYRTKLNDLAALINNCEIIIANDSGPMHISAALKKPILGLFGPTDPVSGYPYGDKNEWTRKDDLFCIQCNLLNCPYNHECFRDLPIEQVMSKIESLIEKNKIYIRQNIEHEK